MQVRIPAFVRPLPILYLLFSFPLVLFQVFATPPFQVADEENHFMRAVQVANGHLIAHRLSPVSAGGDIDTNAYRAQDAFAELKFHPERKLDTALYSDIAALTWGEAGKTTASFANTAIYPPFFYLPAALGLKLGKLSGLSVLDSFYLARLFTGLCATFMAALAVGLCARGRTAMFVVLSFPMALSLFAGITQDALSIASGALVVAIWSHYADRQQDVPWRLRCCAAVLLGGIIAARLPLAPMFGVLFLPTSPARSLFRRSWLSGKDLICNAVGLLPIAFGIVGAKAAKIPFKTDEGVSPADQIAFVLHHPGAALRVAVATLHQWGRDYFDQMVGVLGWLDTRLPSFFYGWMAFWLVLALAIDCLSPARSLSVRSRVVQVCLVAMAAAGVFFALYVAWTPVGAPIVDGVQGRYLFVPVLGALLVLPNLRWWRGGPEGVERHRHVLAMARVLICSVVAVANLWVVPVTVLHRYYGP